MPERVLVVDDEAPARAKVKRFLARDPRFELCGEARDGLEALGMVRDLDPALLVLDIQMPGLTGFEVLEQLETPRPQALFATAFDQHALAAFEAHAVDYLLKPFDEPRFRSALDRAWALLQAGKGEPASVKALLAGLSRRPLERLVVKVEDRWIPIPLRSVRRLSAEGKQVRVHADQGEHLLRRSLQELESRLDPRRFVRVHRSEIVALEAVDHLEPWDHGDALLVLKGGGHLVLSRTYRKAFLEKWGMEG
ncbi:MAG: response regulator transcription factor [Acidobacteria bacterium]|nr:response regulator transcription factor [Acidobacteriota bacterium]